MSQDVWGIKADDSQNKVPMCLLVLLTIGWTPQLSAICSDTDGSDKAAAIRSYQRMHRLCSLWEFLPQPKAPEWSMSFHLYLPQGFLGFLRSPLSDAQRKLKSIFTASSSSCSPHSQHRGIQKPEWWLLWNCAGSRRHFLYLTERNYTGSLEASLPRRKWSRRPEPCFSLLETSLDHQTLLYFGT